MRPHRRFSFILACAFALLLASTGLAEEYLYQAYEQGAIVENAPHSYSDWWYGCTATSTGMAMSFYDRNGYGGLSYDNLIAGGVAPENCIGGTSQNNITKNAIASREHQYDFFGHVNGSSTRVGYTYDTGGGAWEGYSGDDVASPRSTGDYNCIADFLGTSQWSKGNVNGGTTVWNMSRGQAYTSMKTTVAQLESWGKQWDSCLWGVREYIRYAGYDATNCYNQYADQILTPTERTTYGQGFTFADYKAEIDAGRVVLLHYTGHTMFGYGYNTGASGTDQNILLRNTWDSGEELTSWTGTYSKYSYSGTLQSVSVFELTGGDAGGGGSGNTPEPSVTFAIILGAMAAGVLQRRRQRL